VNSLLQLLNLEEYVETLTLQGYNDIDQLLDITWEDLEDIGIRKLGKQNRQTDTTKYRFYVFVQTDRQTDRQTDTTKYRFYVFASLIES